MNGQQLKTIAITAMLLDHIAWAFLDFQSFWGQLFHIVGRITAPTMSFFIVQGYLHTRSFWKYLTRLLVFAVISHVPYVYFSYGTMHWFSFNVLYTLALGMLAV
ncbi:MAG: TraX family protein, partial [Limnochordia bacterium]